MTPVERGNSSRAPPSSPAESEIAPGVFVGGWQDATRFEGVRICVVDEAPAERMRGMEHVPIYDEESEAPIRANLERIAASVTAARERGERVLLFCSRGVRRGPLAGAWYLHAHDHLTLDAAYERIRRVRPQVEHAREWVGDLRSLG